MLTDIVPLIINIFSLVSYQLARRVKWAFLVPTLLSLIGYMTCTSLPATKRPKLGDVDLGVKQRVVVHFLTKEKVIPDEIEERLQGVYGNHMVNRKDVAGSEERKSWTLDRRLQERIVIQFLTAEKVGAKEMFGRLSAVYGKCLPLSTVQRWSKQFKDGRTSVGDLPRPTGIKRQQV